MRAMLLQLPWVEETMQWGANLVFWVGDKTAGGKMFALMDLDGEGGPVIAYAAGPEGFAERVEQEGFRPAPYFARAYWVAAERWDVLRPAEWLNELRRAHGIGEAKLTRRTREALAAQTAATPRAKSRRAGNKGD